MVYTCIWAKIKVYYLEYKTYSGSPLNLECSIPSSGINFEKIISHKMRIFFQSAINYCW